MDMDACKPSFRYIRKISAAAACMLLFGAFQIVWGAEQHVDARRAARTAAATTAAMRHSAQVLGSAARQFGPGVLSSTGDTGRLRMLARNVPPLSPASPHDMETIARRFVLAHGDLLGADDAWLRNLELVALDKSGPNALLKFRQQWAGIPVFQDGLRVHVSPAGEVIEIDFDLESVPLPAGLPMAQSRLAADQALLRCVEDFDTPRRNLRSEIMTAGQGAQYRTRLSFGPNADQVSAQYVWFPVDGLLRLAWHFDAASADSQTYFECIVDAQDGTLLYRASITDFEISGLVFDSSSPQPTATPGLLPPMPNPPVIVPRTLRSFSGDPIASPAGWVGAGNLTIGNNVIAREDKTGDGDATLGVPAAAVNGVFGFDLQLGPNAPSPANYTDAAVTNLFYWGNVAHDYFYNLGFTEAAGNMQQFNFGRGGLESDALKADAQKGSDLTPPFLGCASMSTPIDGSSPKMLTSIWGPTAGPYVDSAFDAEVILHEYSHAVFRRLVGSSCGKQCGALNEGNSDFFSLNYFVPASAPVDGDYIAVGYSKQDFAHGARSRPYSTRFQVNNLTYADFGKIFSTGPEVHADGEIWMEAMWELRARLITKFGYEEGRRRAAQLMMDAMKRSPSDPSFVDMRDALLGADQEDQQGEDIDLIWEAFARRGLGYMAVGGDGSNAMVMASQDLPAALAKVRFREGVLYPGDWVRVYIGDSNEPNPVVTLRIESSGGDSETLSLARSGALFQGMVLTGGGAPASNDGILQVAPGDVIRAMYHDPDDGSGLAGDVVGEAEIRGHYTTELQASNISTLNERLTSRGDDTNLRWDLGFAFPFFDRLISSVNVSTNGLITIGALNNSGNNSESALATMTAIAPFWMNLRTNGNAIAAEGLYVSNPSSPTPTSIRFRWAGETVRKDSQGNLIAGIPVNFAVTLCNNGEILFEYGDGNHGVTPTVGISRGDGMSMQIYSPYSYRYSTGPRDLNNAQAVHWLSGSKVTSTIFPFLRTTATQYTGFALVNPNHQPLDYVFSVHWNGTAFGKTVQDATLSAGMQTAFVAQQSFPFLLPSFSGWAEVKSTDGRMGSFSAWGDHAGTFLNGAPASTWLSKELVFTHTPAGSGTIPGTSLYIINPGDETANLSTRWSDAGQTASFTTTRTLAPGSSLAEDLSALFPTLPPDFKGGSIRVSSDTEITGIVASEAAGATALVAAQKPSYATTLYAPQFANGNAGGIAYFTDVNLVNSSDSLRTVSIQLLGDDGFLVRGAGITNPRTVMLAAGGELHVRGDVLFGLPDPAGPSSPVQGTLVINADGDGLTGDVNFGEALTGRFSASLPLDPALHSDLVFAQVAEGLPGGAGVSYYTGVALFNPNPSETEVKIQMYTQSGLLAGTTVVELLPNSRISWTVGQLIPGVTQNGGHLRVTSMRGPITACGVMGDAGMNFLIALPPQFQDSESEVRPSTALKRLQNSGRGSPYWR